MPKCRACQAPLKKNWIDLGQTPVVNVPLLSQTSQSLLQPLKVMVCEQCWLVQTTVTSSSVSAHFWGNERQGTKLLSSPSSYITNFVRKTMLRAGLDADSLVIDLKLNNSELLKSFKNKFTKVLGITSEEHIAAELRANDINVEVSDWGKLVAEKLSRDGISADLIVANNVLPFVDDIHDFVAGCAHILAENGWIVFNFPHLVALMEHGQFDAITHDQRFYFSLTSLMPLFLHHGLVLADVETLPVRGGELRVWLRHVSASRLDDMCAMRVAGVLSQEWSMPLDDAAGYNGFQERIEQRIAEVRDFLIKAKAEGKRTVAYGATAKGNMLLNVAQLNHDLIDYVVDAVPSRQACWLPGCGLEVKPLECLKDDKPDYLLILPWHRRYEIWEEFSEAFRDWGGQAVVAIPSLELLS